MYLLSGERSQLLDPNTFTALAELPEIPDGKRTYPYTGGSVLLSLKSKNKWLSEILVCGGTSALEKNAPALSSCGRISPTIQNSEWVMEDMPKPRIMPDMSILCDGTILIVNGGQLGWAGFDNAHFPVYTALLYDPDAPVGQRMTELATSTIARLYHSESLVIEDGSVLIMGSAPNANANVDLEYPNERRIEVFYPPYLLSGAKRPTVQKIEQTELTVGTKFEINVHLPTGNPDSAVISLFTSTSG